MVPVVDVFREERQCYCCGGHEHERRLPAPPCREASPSAFSRFYEPHPRFRVQSTRNETGIHFLEVKGFM